MVVEDRLERAVVWPAELAVIHRQKILRRNYVSTGVIETIASGRHSNEKAPDAALTRIGWWLVAESSSLRDKHYEVDFGDLELEYRRECTQRWLAGPAQLCEISIERRLSKRCVRGTAMPPVFDCGVRTLLWSASTEQELNDRR